MCYDLYPLLQNSNFINRYLKICFIKLEIVVCQNYVSELENQSKLVKKSRD